jgi:4'-phosphopantetheinyl transferase
MINIYYTLIRNELPLPVFNKYLNRLPDFLQSDINRYIRWQDRHLVLLGKILLQEAIKDNNYHVGLKDLEYTEYKRPFIRDCFDFNISHSEAITLVACSNNSRVGIDIEKIRQVELSDFNDVLNKDQIQKINSSQDKYSAFFDIWTMKESFIKAIGKGLYLPIKDIICEEGCILFENKKWYCENIMIEPDYVCCLSSDQPIDKINFIEKKYSIL